MYNLSLISYQKLATRGAGKFNSVLSELQPTSWLLALLGLILGQILPISACTVDNACLPKNSTKSTPRDSKLQHKLVHCISKSLISGRCPASDRISDSQCIFSDPSLKRCNQASDCAPRWHRCSPNYSNAA